MKLSDFQTLIQTEGETRFRDMPWRRDTRPYYVLVSELMLQQTQVPRVIPKFEAFISAFPDIASLASAGLSEVLILWQGLGYNRRAKFLHEAARKIMSDWDGEFPENLEDLQKLPGVGPNTAGAIMAYAFNQPVIFIETNVRTVYFHSFFEPNEVVTDAQLRSLVEDTIDRQNPRSFYWALMDYGSYLKSSGVKNNAQSHHYVKQSTLKGSVREVRGQILRALTGGGKTEESLRHALDADLRFEPALAGLEKDGLVGRTNEQLHLTN